MKPHITTLFFLMICSGIFGQNNREYSSPLKVEWKKELAGPNVGVSGLLLSDQKICITQTGETSIFKILDLNGIIVFNAFVDKMRIRSLQKVNESIFTIGDHHLSRRNQEGPIESEKKLYWIDNSWIHMVNGEIYNGKLYTTNSSRDLVTYSLDGEQLWRKQLGNTVINQFLQAKTAHIYLYSIFQDPPLGARLLQYDTLGNLHWSIEAGMVNNILADEQGNCYVFIVKPQTSNIVTKYNPEGEAIWSKVVPGQAIGNGFLLGDSLFVCGIEAIDAAGGGVQDAAFSILSAVNGEIYHQQQFDFYPPEDWSESFTHIVSDGNTIFLGGQTYGEVKKSFLVKLSRQGNTTGLQDEKASRTGFNIFPNPGGAKFTISCEQANAATLKVTVRNVAGQVIQKKEIPCEGKKSWELDLGKQPAGNYSVEIISGNEQVVKKIVVE